MRVIDLLDGWLLVLFVFLIGGAALPAVALPLCYAMLSRFWESSHGKFLFYQSIVIGVALGQSAMRLFFPPAPTWVTIVLYAMIFIMVWWSLLLYLRTYFRARRKRREDRQREESGSA